VAGPRQLAVFRRPRRRARVRLQV